MKMKQFISVFLLTVLIFTFCACKKGTDTETTDESTSVSDESTTADSTTVKEGESADVKTTAADETTTAKVFAFDSAKATKIGSFNSEIYGQLTIYLQDGMFAIFDSYGTQKFLVSAEGYSPSNVSVGVSAEYEDMNFDGYTDFRLLFRIGTYDSYYYCWLWNMSARTFEYYVPLSSLASPDFDSENKIVTSFSHASATQSTVTTYKWIDGNISVISTKNVNNTQSQPTNAEIVDTQLVYTDGENSADISLTGNPNSASRWICKIENESIVKLIYDKYDYSTGTYNFTLQGYNTGSTTVVFRYATGWDADYVVQKVINVRVDNNLKIYITEIEG